MKLTVKTVTRPGKNALTLVQLKREFMKIRKAYVKAGVLGSPEHGAKHAKGRAPARSITNAQLAAIAEYGLSNAPARPWIGPPFRHKRNEYLAKLRKAYKEALEAGKPSMVTHELELIGQEMAADIKNYVTLGAGVPPPNAPSTIARKGSSRPLVDTGEMVGSISYLVVGGETSHGHH